MTSLIQNAVTTSSTLPLYLLLLASYYRFGADDAVSYFHDLYVTVNLMLQVHYTCKHSYFLTMRSLKLLIFLLIVSALQGVVVKTALLSIHGSAIHHSYIQDNHHQVGFPVNLIMYQ